jgi:predicted RNase H-like HicB family nuclease
LNVKVEPLAEGGFLATSRDLPGLVVQGRKRAETIELAQANARLLIEVYLAEKLPLPPALRRVLKRKPTTLTLPLPVAFPVAA